MTALDNSPSLRASHKEPILAWHFLSTEEGTLRLRDGRPAPTIGDVLTYTGPLQICRAGLHASERLIDALRYAPSSVCCRVACSGWVYAQEDKLVCSRRVILQQADVTQALRAGARRFALAVFPAAPAMPEPVRDWLLTGDERYRADAESAAHSAAYSAARSAADAAAWMAAWPAAYSAADSAAYLATYSAADSAARSAADAAANATVYSAAYSAASWAANTLLTSYVEEAFAGRTGWAIDSAVIGSWQGLGLPDRPAG